MPWSARISLFGLLILVLAAAAPAFALAPHGTWKEEYSDFSAELEFSLLPGAPLKGKPRSLQAGGFFQTFVPALENCEEEGDPGYFETPLSSGSAYEQIGLRYRRAYGSSNRMIVDLRYTKRDTWVGSFSYSDTSWYCNNDEGSRAFEFTRHFTLKCQDPICGTRKGVAVPALIGKTEAEAVRILRAKGFKPRIREVQRGSGYPGTAKPQVPIGRVTLHFPSYGKRQKRGGRVLLYVRGERPGPGGRRPDRDPR